MKHLGDKEPRLRGIYWIEDAGPCSGVYVLDGGRTLIDAGNMYGLIDEIGDLIPPHQIERVILTHSHFDHVGGLAEIFQVANPDLYLHRITRGYLDLHRPPFPEFFAALQKKDKLKFVSDGDIILGDHNIRVLYTPGHTAGDICLYMADIKTLASGDIAISADCQYGMIVSKPDEVCGGRFQDRIASLKRLLSLKIKTLLPGHGSPVIENGHDQIKIQLLETFRIQEGDDSEEPWLKMAEVLRATGDLEGALDCCRKVLKINKDCEKALKMIRDLGTLYESLFCPWR